MELLSSKIAFLIVQRLSLLGCCIPQLIVCVWLFVIFSSLASIFFSKFTCVGFKMPVPFKQISVHGMWKTTRKVHFYFLVQDIVVEKIQSIYQEETLNLFAKYPIVFNFLSVKLLYRWQQQLIFIQKKNKRDICNRQTQEPINKMVILDYCEIT